jgi:hypothetical protein
MKTSLACTTILALFAFDLVACGSKAPTPIGVPGIAVAPAIEPRPHPHMHGGGAGTAMTTTMTTGRLSAPIDEKAVTGATGVAQSESDAGVVKVSFPRTDVPITVDGWKMPPFMGLTSWVAFAPAREGVAETMIMGDLVLFEDEVSAVMSTLLEGGAQVTALHNHFFFDQPHVYFMHVGGEGTVKSLGSTVKAAMDKVGEIRKKTPRPSSTFNVGSSPLAGGVAATSNLDATKLETLMGRKGTAKDGMWKLVVGRDVTSSCGCTSGKSMGVTTWAAFAGTDDVAVVDGDFAVTEDELQAVLKELRTGGVHVVAIHHHMSGETPRMLFLHFWGRGKVADLAGIIKRALERTRV